MPRAPSIILTAIFAIASLIGYKVGNDFILLLFGILAFTPAAVIIYKDVIMQDIEN